MSVLDYDFPVFMPFKVGYEFDFMREANAMEKLRCFLYENNKKTPVLVPRVVRDMVTRFVLPHPNILLSEIASADKNKKHTSYLYAISVHIIVFLGNLALSSLIEKIFSL